MPQDKDRRVSPIRLSLLITICERGKASFYADLIQGFDVNMQFITQAMGSAEGDFFRYFGLTEYEQSAIFSVVREDKLDELIETLETKFRSIKGGEGIAFTLPFTSLIGTLVFGFLTNEKEMVQNERT